MTDNLRDLITKLEERLSRLPIEDEVFKFIYGDENTKREIWNSVKKEIHERMLMDNIGEAKRVPLVVHIDGERKVIGDVYVYPDGYVTAKFKNQREYQHLGTFLKELTLDAVSIKKSEEEKNVE